MTTSNENVVKAEMTENALKAKAKSLGYKAVYHNAKCPACNHKLFKFNKSNHPYLVACTCGYREVVAKKEYKRSNVCVTEGCNAILCKHDTDGICTKCRLAAEKNTQPAPEKKSERLCKCGNPLPADRKQRCYSCQPQSKRAKAAAKKESAQQRVDM